MFDQGGLAGAVLTDEAEDAAPCNLERHVVEGEFVAELPGQSGDFNNGRIDGCIHWFAYGCMDWWRWWMSLSKSPERLPNVWLWRGGHSAVGRESLAALSAPAGNRHRKCRCPNRDV